MHAFLIISPKIMLFAAVALMLSWAALAQMTGGLATVRAPTLLEMDGRVWQLFGVRSVPPDAVCTRDGTAFACGAHVMRMAGEFIAGRRVTCERRERPGADAAQGICSAAGEDIGAWLVRNGWAFADAEVSVNYLVDENYAKMQKVGFWQPGIDLRR